MPAWQAGRRPRPLHGTKFSWRSAQRYRHWSIMSSSGMLENPQPPSEPRPSPARSAGFNPLSWMRDLAFSVLIAVVLIVFIYQPVKVEGTSMMPTLTDQERIFINKFTYH